MSCFISQGAPGVEERQGIVHLNNPTPSQHKMYESKSPASDCKIIQCNIFMHFSKVCAFNSEQFIKLQLMYLQHCAFLRYEIDQNLL